MNPADVDACIQCSRKKNADETQPPGSPEAPRLWQCDACESDNKGLDSVCATCLVPRASESRVGGDAGAGSASQVPGGGFKAAVGGWGSGAAKSGGFGMAGQGERKPDTTPSPLQTPTWGASGFGGGDNSNSGFGFGGGFSSAPFGGGFGAASVGGVATDPLGFGSATPKATDPLGFEGSVSSSAHEGPPAFSSVPFGGGFGAPSAGPAADPLRVESATPAATGLAVSSAPDKPTAKFEGGIWECPNAACKQHNPASATNCILCETSNPAAEKGVGAAATGSAAVSSAATAGSSTSDSTGGIGVAQSSGGGASAPSPDAEKSSLPPKQALPDTGSAADAKPPTKSTSKGGGLPGFDGAFAAPKQALPGTPSSIEGPEPAVDRKPLNKSGSGKGGGLPSFAGAFAAPKQTLPDRKEGQALPDQKEGQAAVDVKPPTKSAGTGGLPSFAGAFAAPKQALPGTLSSKEGPEPAVDSKPLNKSGSVKGGLPVFGMPFSPATQALSAALSSKASSPIKAEPVAVQATASANDEAEDGDDAFEKPFDFGSSFGGPSGAAASGFQFGVPTSGGASGFQFDSNAFTFTLGKSNKPVDDLDSEGSGSARGGASKTTVNPASTPASGSDAAVGFDANAFTFTLGKSNKPVDDLDSEGSGSARGGASKTTPLAAGGAAAGFSANAFTFSMGKSTNDESESDSSTAQPPPAGQPFAFDFSAVSVPGYAADPLNVNFQGLAFADHPLGAEGELTQLVQPQAKASCSSCPSLQDATDGDEGDEYEGTGEEGASSSSKSSPLALRPAGFSFASSGKQVVESIGGFFTRSLCRLLTLLTLHSCGATQAQGQGRGRGGRCQHR
jgi:hypothetical protein